MPFGPPARRGRCAIQCSMPQGGTALLSSLFSSSLQVSVVVAELCGNKGVDLVPRCSLVLINGRGRGWGGAAPIQDGRPRKWRHRPHRFVMPFSKMAPGMAAPTLQMAPPRSAHASSCVATAVAKQPRFPFHRACAPLPVAKQRRHFVGGAGAIL